MRTVLLVNNYVGYRALQLAVENSEVVAVGVHPEGNSQYRSEILDAIPASATVFDGASVNGRFTISSLAALQPDLVLSVFFGYILKKDFLDSLRVPTVNVHPGLLPFNRGAYPNVWPIIDGTPAGVTIHLIDEGIDTGPVIAQRAVDVEITDTGQSLYTKLEQACVSLLEEVWPLLEADPIESQPQQPGTGTFHRKSDVNEIDKINLDELYPARQLIDLIRARTFDNAQGAYFLSQDQRIYVRLSLESDSDSWSD